MKELTKIIQLLSQIYATCTMTQEQETALNHSLSFLNKLNGFIYSLEILGKEFHYDSEDGDTNG